MARRVIAVVAFLILVNACGSETEEASAVTGDGVLDCPDGQVVRSAEIDVSAESEHEVVAAALARWTDEGGSVVENPPDESWYVVQGGRDVAIAYPEMNGDGTWTAHDVRTCGEPESGPAAIDGELDCANESSWGIQGTIDPTIPGLPSAEEAVRSALEPYAQRHGGEIVLIEDNIGSLAPILASGAEVGDGGACEAGSLAGRVFPVDRRHCLGSVSLSVDRRVRF